MKINSVSMMRRIRDELDQQIQEMTWEEENDFLRKNLTSFQFLVTPKFKVTVEDFKKNHQAFSLVGK